MVDKGELELFVDNSEKRDEIFRKILENIELFTLAKGSEIESYSKYRTRSLLPNDPSNMMVIPNQLEDEGKRRVQRCQKKMRIGYFIKSAEFPVAII